LELIEDAARQQNFERVVTLGLEISELSVVHELGRKHEIGARL
jgi:Zn finger protein HypA/HybF involved in hydrogenase expression